METLNYEIHTTLNTKLEDDDNDDDDDDDIVPHLRIKMRHVIMIDAWKVTAPIGVIQ